VVLDTLAHSEQPFSVQVLFQNVQAQMRANDIEIMRSLLRLLQRDHYIIQNADGTFQFRLRLIQRAWKIQRALKPL